jgi:molybdate transport system substrate-binding protein
MRSSRSAQQSPPRSAPLGDAPADIFFSADLDWMDYLQQRNLIDTASRRTLLGNTLVLVAPKASTVSLAIERDFPILQALGPDGKLAMASVDSVPAGKYGKAALTYFGFGRL